VAPRLAQIAARDPKAPQGRDQSQAEAEGLRVAGLDVNGTIQGQGNLVIAGSKAGYVVDIMRNVDTVALTPGDVVVIVGTSAPVLGEIPAVTV